MQLISLLFIVAAIPSLLVKGWTIPEGQPSGLYSVTKDESGNEIHTHVIFAPDADSIWVDLGDVQPTPRSAKFGKRQVGGLTEQCGGYAMDTTDTNNAVNCLYTFIRQEWDQELNPNFDWYCRSGSVVAYLCNFSSDTS
jgi:hypothetical protein